MQAYVRFKCRSCKNETARIHWPPPMGDVNQKHTENFKYRASEDDTDQQQPPRFSCTLGSLPRLIAPMRRPYPRVWVPEGQSWFPNPLEHLRKVYQRRARPPSYRAEPEEDMAARTTRPESAPSVPAPVPEPAPALEPSPTDAKAASRPDKGVSPSVFGSAGRFFRKEVEFFKDFKQWRREKRVKRRTNAEMPESDAEPTVEEAANVPQEPILEPAPEPALEPGHNRRAPKGPYEFVIGFEGPGENPNWRGKLVMEIRDPIKETSWLGPLDVDSPRWMWENWRLPDQWFEGWETPTMKYRQGQSEATMLEVDKPLW